MADEKDPNRPYTLHDLQDAVAELNNAERVLADTRCTLKRHRDAIKSFEKQEQEQEAEVARRKAHVKKVGGNLEK